MATVGFKGLTILTTIQSLPLVRVWGLDD